MFRDPRNETALWAAGNMSSLISYSNSQIEWKNKSFGIKDESMTNHPVVGVIWHGSQFFSNPISLKDWSVDPTIAGWRLPTDAEWEYAARSGYDKAKYPWWTKDDGTHTDPNASTANFNNNEAGTTPVGKYAANGYGLYDMAGNVWEWCSDWYSIDAYDVVGDAVDPVDPSTGSYRVYRGGSFFNVGADIRCAKRSGSPPAFKSGYIPGFRPAKGQGVPSSPN